MKVVEKINNIIPEGSRVVLALSGGPDSVFLFYQFIEAMKIKKLDLVCAHLHHGLRPEADQDLLFVKNLCNQYQIPLKAEKEDVEAFASQNKMSTEEAGRALRYKLFYRLAGKEGYIALAHHQIDQAETMLIRLMRGTGIHGLGAMRELDGQLLRPMLDLKKEDILTYLDTRGLDYCVDKTNFQAIYVRNKVRLELLPLMRSFNPNVEDVLYSLSLQCQEAEDSLNHIAQLFIDKKVRNSKGKMEFTIEEFIKEDKAIQTRVLRNMINLMQGNRVNLSNQHIESLLYLIRGQTGREIHLPNGYKGRINYNDFILERVKTGKLSLPEEKTLKQGENQFAHWTIDVSIKKENHEREVNDNFSLYLEDLNGVSVRSRNPGDKLDLVGGLGRKKLKDLFIDRKVDREKRDTWPVVLKEDKIIWVPGLYKVQEKKENNKCCYKLRAREEK